MTLKEIILGKKLSCKFSNALFSQEPEGCYVIKSNWRDVSKPIFMKTIRRFLFETLSDRDDYVEVDTLTQFLVMPDKFEPIVIPSSFVVVPC